VASTRPKPFVRVLTRGDALRACPWLLYLAPLALFDFEAKLTYSIAQHLAEDLKVLIR